MIVLYLMVARIATNLAIMVVVVLGMVLLSHKLNKTHKLNKGSENCLDVEENLKTEKSVKEKQPAEDLCILPHSWNRNI